MAIVPDLARSGYTEWGDYKTPPYNSTPPLSWQNGWAWLTIGSEVHVGRAYETPVNNTADDWVPMSLAVHTLDKTVQTVRFS